MHLLLVIESKLILKNYDSHFLAFELEEFNADWLHGHFYRILLGEQFEVGVGKDVVRYHLICGSSYQIWKVQARTYYPGVGFDSLGWLVLVVLHKKTDLAFSSDCNNHILFGKRPMR